MHCSGCGRGLRLQLKPTARAGLGSQVDFSANGDQSQVCIVSEASIKGGHSAKKRGDVVQAIPPDQEQHTRGVVIDLLDYSRYTIGKCEPTPPSPWWVVIYFVAEEEHFPTHAREAYISITLVLPCAFCCGISCVLKSWKKAEA